MAGSKTLKVLYSGNAISATSSSGNYESLSKGSKGTAVVELQESLYKLGYLSEITGKADNTTQRAIYSGSAKPAW